MVFTWVFLPSRILSVCTVFWQKIICLGHLGISEQADCILPTDMPEVSIKPSQKSVIVTTS